MGGLKSYFKIHENIVVMSGLRVIGVKVFVHIETHRAKLDDKAHDEKIVGLSIDSKACRI